jgi:hypothetical protein
MTRNMTEDLTEMTRGDTLVVITGIEVLLMFIVVILSKNH